VSKTGVSEYKNTTGEFSTKHEKQQIIQTGDKKDIFGRTEIVE